MDRKSKTAILLITTQTALTVFSSLVVFGLSGARAALAAAIGGGICIITTALFSLRLFSGQPEGSAERFLRRFYWAEAQKIVVTVMLLIGAIRWLPVPALPLTLTFLVALMAYWMILLIKI